MQFRLGLAAEDRRAREAAEHARPQRQLRRERPPDPEPEQRPTTRRLTESQEAQNRGYLFQKVLFDACIRQESLELNWIAHNQQLPRNMTLAQLQQYQNQPQDIR